MNAKTKILILGNNGFIGKAIFENLSSISDLQVEGFNSSTLDLSGKDSFHQLGEKVDKSTSVNGFANADPQTSWLERPSISNCVYHPVDISRNDY